MNTIEELQQFVAECQAKTAIIMEANPAIKSVDWELLDIPYDAFEGYRELLNKDAKDHNFISRDSLNNNKLFYRPINSYGHGCEILFISLPVKFKHTYEVITEG